MPAVAAPVMRGKSDFSVGSRNIKGGGLGETCHALSHGFFSL